MGLVSALRRLSYYGHDPKVVNRVEGFDVCLETIERVLLTRKDEATGQDKPASIGQYFEVAVRPNGQNPEYPAQPDSSHFRFTRLADRTENGMGFMGSTGYLPNAAIYTQFELVEEFDDGKPKGIFMGKLMPPHHSVMLRAHFIDADGRKSQCAMGGWVRKSERESPEWRMAASSPVTYF